MSQERGHFIVFEGIDRAGKTSAAKTVAEKIPNSVYVRFPNRESITGGTINNYLAGDIELCNEAVHLLFCANQYEDQARIHTLLESGTNVICDRYCHSTYAYSTAKGLDGEWCKRADDTLISPDLVVYFDIDPVVASNRGDYGGERYEKVAFQKQVRAQFEHLFKQLESVPVESIDATSDKEKLALDAQNIVSSWLATKPGPIRIRPW